MNNQDKISLVSLPVPLLASITKKIVKVVVLAHKSHVCDHLRGRTSVAIQVKLLSDRKKYQAYSVIENNKKAMHIPNYQRLYAYLVGAHRPTIVDNKGIVL